MENCFEIIDFCLVMFNDLYLSIFEVLDVLIKRILLIF